MQKAGARVPAFNVHICEKNADYKNNKKSPRVSVKQGQEMLEIYRQYTATV